MSPYRTAAIVPAPVVVDEPKMTLLEWLGTRQEAFENWFDDVEHNWDKGPADAAVGGDPMRRLGNDNG